MVDIKSMMEFKTMFISFGICVLGVSTGVESTITQTTSSYINNNEGNTNFPDITNRSTLTTVSVQGNQISNISSELLTGFDAITFLDMSINQFSEFPDLSPIGETLSKLQLSDNQISDIPVGRMDSLDTLNHLNLGRNYFSIFPNVTDISNSLRTLLLNNNQITVVPIDVIKHMHLLSTLHMTYNPLVSLPDLTSIANSVTTLSLCCGEIPTVEDYKIEPLHSLTSLLLSRNKLTYFPNVSLTASLTNLELHSNQITNITSEHWLLGKDDANTVVTLYDNPLVSIQPPDTFSKRQFEFDSTQLTALPPCQLSHLAPANEHGMILCNDECSASNLILDAAIACSQSMGPPNKGYPDKFYIREGIEPPLTGEIVSARGLMDCGRLCSERHWCLGFYYSHSRRCALKFENNGMNSALPENEQWQFNAKWNK